jgi:hypothetical protein
MPPVKTTQVGVQSVLIHSTLGIFKHENYFEWFDNFVASLAVFQVSDSACSIHFQTFDCGSPVIGSGMLLIFVWIRPLP